MPQRAAKAKTPTRTPEAVKLIGYETCPECYGSGVVKKGPCENCNGTGRIPIHEEEEGDAESRSI